MPTQPIKRKNNKNNQYTKNYITNIATSRQLKKWLLKTNHMVTPFAQTIQDEADNIAPNIIKRYLKDSGDRSKAVDILLASPINDSVFNQTETYLEEMQKREAAETDLFVSKAFNTGALAPWPSTSADILATMHAMELDFDRSPSDDSTLSPISGSPSSTSSASLWSLSNLSSLSTTPLHTPTTSRPGSPLTADAALAGIPSPLNVHKPLIDDNATFFLDDEEHDPIGAGLFSRNPLAMLDSTQNTPTASPVKAARSGSNVTADNNPAATEEAVFRPFTGFANL